MAVTTFNGAVRSENGFKVINKNAATVAITVPVVPAAKIMLLYRFSVLC